MAVSNSTPKPRRKSAAVPTLNAPIGFPDDTEDRLVCVTAALRGAMQLIEGAVNDDTSADLLPAKTVIHLVVKEIEEIYATAGHTEVAHV